jgi:hypothetical protein
MASISYTPPPTIRDFIRHYEQGKLFFDWIIGPVGSGKTTGIFFKLCYMASLQAKSPVDGKRRSRAVIVRNTMPQLRDTTLSSWNYWFKDGQAGVWYATSPMPMTFVLKFGDVECEVLFRALDTADDVARVLSLEVTFAILDEFVQIDEKIVEALAARCGRYPPTKDGGATNWGMWGSSNPGNEDDWWYDYLYEKRPANVTLYEQPSGFLPIAENLANLPGGAEYYTSLAVGKSEHWVKQFIEVQWGYSLAGSPVITTFNPHIHVAKVPLLPSPVLPLVAGFDPGLKGSALIFGQMDLNGRLTVLDELFQQNMGAERIISDRLKPLLKLRFDGYDFVIAPDPAADSRSSNDERTIVDTLRDRRKGGFTVKFPDMNNRLPLRVEAIEHFTTRLTANGPALLIDPRCKNLIRALQGGWRYEMTAKGKLGAEPEKNRYSHPGDAFGYLCRYFQHTTEREAKRKEKDAVPLRRHVNSYVLR